jgi:two-component system response regulator (stage 0 sporulation protein F)
VTVDKTGRRRALVADDDGELRETVAEWVGLQGFDVSRATNGLEALLRVKRERPHLIVLDLSMPRLGGLDALRRIRVFDPSIKVVVVTGSDDPGARQEALRLGAARVLQKPVDFEELRKALGQPVAAGAPGDARAGEPQTAASHGRILVIDDDVDLCRTLEEILRDAGYSVRSAETMAGAFFAVTESLPDVILLDIRLPGLSGVDIIPAIRSARRDVKIIMVSGETDAAVARRALAAGAFDFVTKPIDTGHLLQTVEAAMMLIRFGSE